MARQPREMGDVSKHYAETAFAITERQGKTLEALGKHLTTSEQRELLSKAIAEQATATLNISWALQPPKRY